MASLQISWYARYVDGLAKIVSMQGREGACRKSCIESTFKDNKKSGSNTKIIEKIVLL